MKRFLALLLVVLMSVSLFACKDDDAPAGDTQTPTQPTEEVDPSKVIDIYLIAGQSNAVGHTTFSDNYKYYLAQFAPELAEGGSGYSHVYYAGNSRTNKRDSNGAPVIINRDKPWQKVSLGLGVDDNRIGPEVGMAKAFAAYYNAESGRSAGIIKFAHGGTNLLNVTVGSSQCGNWVSPSYAKHMGVAYSDTAITGGLYRGLLEQVKRNVSELYEYGGYEQVNIKGLYWMQGESDRNSPAEYEKAFKFFAEDVRKDLSAIMLEFTNGKSDCGASEMAIFVGAISKGFSLENSSTESTVNVPFIDMQKRLAENIENCYFVDNSGYAITKWDKVRNKAIILGSDGAHWNAKDMLDIGNNVGAMMLEKCVVNSSAK